MAVMALVSVYEGQREPDGLTLGERRRVLTENAMCAIDELVEELQRTRKRGLVCPSHGSSRIPTVCPVCALVECRLRLAGGQR
jgi:hypothetical protein